MRSGWVSFMKGGGRGDQEDTFETLEAACAEALKWSKVLLRETGKPAGHKEGDWDAKAQDGGGSFSAVYRPCNEMHRPASWVFCFLNVCNSRLPLLCLYLIL